MSSVPLQWPVLIKKRRKIFMSYALDTTALLRKIVQSRGPKAEQGALEMIRCQRGKEMDEIIRKLQDRITLAEQDVEFVKAVQGLRCTLLLTVTRLPGRTFSIRTGESDACSPEIIITAAPETWRKILDANAPPGYQSFTAAYRFADNFEVQCQPLHLAQGLHALERLFELLRGQHHATGYALDRSAITGKYCQIPVGDAPTSIYFEQSGSSDAPPLVMLHTAGADSRQYHAIMTDQALQSQWRLLAFDMPGHGRSMPLPGTAWIAGGLTRDLYLEICLAFIRNVACGPAVVLGCSMGAAMALYLATRHPEYTAGVIALEAPYKALGRRTSFLCHTQVNQSAHNPAYVRGLMGPSATLDARREAAWIYSQGGFNIYANDLSFYSDDFDASVHLTGLNTSTFGISLLTGAYDYSATPADSAKVAKCIPGARFRTMPELGHFPMVENSECLLSYLRPELLHIKKSRIATTS